MDALKRHSYGKKTEKLPPMTREVKRGQPRDPEHALQEGESSAGDRLTPNEPDCSGSCAAARPGLYDG